MKTMSLSGLARSLSHFKKLFKVYLDKIVHIGGNTLQGPWLVFQVIRPGWWEFLFRPGGRTQTTQNIPPARPLFGSKSAQ